MAWKKCCTLLTRQANDHPGNYKLKTESTQALAVSPNGKFLASTGA